MPQASVIFLVLDMARPISLLITGMMVFISCNSDDKTETLLSQPPYDKLTDSIRMSPKEAPLYYRRGSLLYHNSQFPYAERDLRQAWELQPNETFALGLTTILKEKAPDSAIAFIREALKKIPESIPLRIGLARGFQQKGQWDEAMRVCNEIIAKYPSQLDALMLKSELYKEKNRNEEALATLESAYAFAPGDVELVHELAFDYAEAKNPKAIRLSDSLIRVDVAASHAEPYYFKGVYYTNTGNATEAIHQFDLAIAHNYNFINAYVNKGILYYDQKKYAEAQKTFGLAITVAPDQADPYYWLAKVQEATGNRAEARLNYQRAYGLDKTMSEAKEGAERLK